MDGLIDRLHTMYLKGNLSMTDYRIWFELKTVPKDIQKAKEENIRFKKALWCENDKEIRTEMDKLSKVKD